MFRPVERTSDKRRAARCGRRFSGEEEEVKVAGILQEMMRTYRVNRG